MMDNPEANVSELDHALAHLEIINRILGGYKGSLYGVRRFADMPPSSFSLLDVGCGSGDTLREIAKWARKNKIPMQLFGIERCPATADRAKRLCQDWPEIEIRHANLYDMPPVPSFDVVHCALVLHHFSDDSDAARALAQMSKLARKGVVVNDLHRNLFAYSAIWVLTRVFSRSRILQNDAPLSVARAFTRQELLQLAGTAGLSGVRIKWQWAFRWMMTADKWG